MLLIGIEHESMLVATFRPNNWLTTHTKIILNCDCFFTFFLIAWTDVSCDCTMSSIPVLSFMLLNVSLPSASGSAAFSACLFVSLLLTD